MQRLLSSCLLTLGLVFAAPLYAADTINLLVMGEDADEDTVPRDSRVFKRVISALQNQISDQGFNIYDETAVTMDNFTQGRVRRADNELLDIARSITRPPIDVVVVFSLYARANNEKSYKMEADAFITGRMLDAKSGKFLGEFEVDKLRPWSLKPPCNRECIIDSVGDKSRELANDLGAVLAEKLDWMVGGDSSGTERGAVNEYVKDYYLVFDGFTGEDMMALEEYLVIFSGYESHRPSEESHTKTTLLYRSKISGAKLSRNLKKMLNEVDMRATLDVDGDTYRLKRITLRNASKKPAAKDGW